MRIETGIKQVQHLKVGDEFIGWKQLQYLVEECENDFTKLLLLTIFKTGGRIGEVLTLRKSNFNFELSDKSIVVEKMDLEKQYDVEKVIPIDDKHYRLITRKVDAKRDSFPILREEKLTSLWLELLEKSRSNLLFYGWSRKIPMTRQYAHRLIRNTGLKLDRRISPHYIRGQRCSQLKDDYRFRREESDRFFGWKPNINIQSYRYGKMSWMSLEMMMIEGMNRLKNLGLW